MVLLADDLGWDEVSWHNKKVLTPHMQVTDWGHMEEAHDYVEDKYGRSRSWPGSLFGLI